MYQRYHNVTMTPKFVPLLGDSAVVLKYKNENKYMFWEHIQNGVDHPECDIKFGLRGSDIRFYITSSEAVKQFINCIPTNADRGTEQNRFFGKLAPLAFGSLTSTQNWKDRRNAITSCIGLNYTSKYIPLMISSLETTISSWKPNQWLDFNEELSSATFNIVSTIFFGMDMDSKIEKVTYTELNDSQIQLPFKEFFIKLVEDIVKSSMNPLSTFFPFVIEYNLCKPYTTIEKNCVELRAVLKRFLDRSSD